MKKNSNIIFLEQYGSLGGGQQILQELIQVAKFLQYNTNVLIPDGMCTNKIQMLGINVYKISICPEMKGKKSIKDIIKMLLWNIQIFLKYWRILRNSSLIYVNGNRLSPLAMLMQKLFHKNVVYHIHLNYSPNELKLMSYFMKSNYTKAIIAPSKFIFEKLYALNKELINKKLKLVENGLDSRFLNFSFEDKFTNKKLKHIGIVGRVTPEKGQDILISLAKFFPNLIFHVLGDAAFSQKQYYEDLKSNSPANIYYHGWIDDISVKVREIGIQVSISPTREDFEAAPLVPLQMASLSCLIVARNKGGLTETVTNIHGDLFENDEELKVYFDKLLETPTDILAKKAYDTYNAVLQRYSNKKFQERLIHLFSQL